MYQRVREGLNEELSQIREAGLFKEERIILSDQKPIIDVSYPGARNPGRC